MDGYRENTAARATVGEEYGRSPLWMHSPPTRPKTERRSATSFFRRPNYEIGPRPTHKLMDLRIIPRGTLGRIESETPSGKANGKFSESTRNLGGFCTNMVSEINQFIQVICGNPPCGGRRINLFLCIRTDATAVTVKHDCYQGVGLHDEASTSRFRCSAKFSSNGFSIVHSE